MDAQTSALAAHGQIRSPTIGSPDETAHGLPGARIDRPRRATAPGFPAYAGVLEGTTQLIFADWLPQDRTFESERIAGLEIERK